MFKDITMGQYYPANSLVHKLDPRTKLLFTLIYIIFLFVANNLWGYAAALIMLVTAIILSKIPVGYLLKGLKAIFLIIILTVVLNMFMTAGTPLWSWGPLTITREGVERAGFLALRLILLITATNLMTLTTSPIDLTDGMERGFRWIPFIRKYAHEISMMMSIALRFIPTLMEETEKIINAQKARGADFETGGLIAKGKALVPILVPLFISAFRRADELATAMEARCYRGGENRTRMKELKYKARDHVTFVVMLLFCGAIIYSRYCPAPFGLKVG